MARDDLDKTRLTREEEAYYQKVAFHQQTLFSAWLENRMEYVGRILTLSVLAIGFLVSFLAIFEKDITSNWYVLIPWGIANLAFVRTITLALRITRDDSQYIINILNILHDESDREGKEVLAEYEAVLYNEKKWASWFFFAGVFFTLVFVVFHIYM